MKRSKWTSDLHWVREGQQDRSRKTQAALLDAAEDLFAQHGIDGATIADISKAAGCSIGAFYHHYRDKSALRYALFDRFATEFDEDNRLALDPDRWCGAKVADILAGYVQLTIEHDRDNPARRRSGVMLARSEPEIESHLIKLRVALDTRLRVLLLARRHEIGHPNPDLAITFVLDQLGSMLRLRLHEPEMPSRFATRADEEFLAEAMRSVCAYLQIDLPTEHAADEAPR